MSNRTDNVREMPTQPGTAYFAVADATALPLADASVDLVMTSPPYLNARLYLEGGKNLGVARNCDAWIDWSLLWIRECLRVCRGPVIVNCAGQTKDRNYQPGPEGLLYRAFQAGISSYRPAIFHRVGIPGSGGTDWLRADTEYLLCFKADGALPTFNLSAIGHPPKWAPGGEMSNRLSSGARVNQWGHSIDSGATVTDGTDCARCFWQKLGEWYQLWLNHPDIYRDSVLQEQQSGHTFRSPGRDTWPVSLEKLAAEFASGRKPTVSLKMMESRKAMCRVCAL